MRNWTPTKSDMLIYDFMKAGNVVDLFESIYKFRISAIRNAIWRLNKHGYTVHSEIVTRANDRNEIKRFAKYSVKA